MKTLYYFSGTGNTLYLGKKLQSLCKYDLIDISTLDFDNIILSGEVGILFPVYAMGIPNIIEKFLKNCKVKDLKYIFAIATCGGNGYGIPFIQINNILKEKKIELNYSEYHHMPDNYIKLFKPLSGERAKNDIMSSDNKIIAIAKDINNNEFKSAKNSKVLYFIFSAIYKFWKNNLKNVHKKFTVSDKCTSCGICESVCPVKNIKIIDNLPIWESRCEDCLACVNLCPVVAINCGGASKKGVRYKNPFINLKELMR